MTWHRMAWQIHTVRYGTYLQQAASQALSVPRDVMVVQVVLTLGSAENALLGEARVHDQGAPPPSVDQDLRARVPVPPAG